MFKTFEKIQIQTTLKPLTTHIPGVDLIRTPMRYMERKKRKLSKAET